MQGTPYGTVLGYFTLEDVLEEVIQEDIEDEKDISKQAKTLQLLAPSDAPSLCNEAFLETSCISLTPEDDGENEDFDNCHFIDSCGSCEADI